MSYFGFEAQLQVIVTRSVAPPRSFVDFSVVTDRTNTRIPFLPAPHRDVDLL